MQKSNRSMFSYNVITIYCDLVLEATLLSSGKITLLQTFKIGISCTQLSLNWEKHLKINIC